MNNLLFVYGSLLSDASNDFSKLLKNSSKFLNKGYVYAQKYDLGPYFGIKLDPLKKHKVNGELYSITPDSLHVVLRVLDDYEGFISEKHPDNLFDRVKTEVFNSSQSTKAWVYEYSLSVKGYTPMSNLR